MLYPILLRVIKDSLRRCATEVSKESPRSTIQQGAGAASFLSLPPFQHDDKEHALCQFPPKFPPSCIPTPCQRTAIRLGLTSLYLFCPTQLTSCFRGRSFATYDCIRTTHICSGRITNITTSNMLTSAARRGLRTAATFGPSKCGVAMGRGTSAPRLQFSSTCTTFDLTGAFEVSV